MQQLPPNLPLRLRHVVVAWTAYLVVFQFAHETFINDAAAAFLLVPLLTGVWHFGMVGGVAGAVLMWPVQAALFLLADHQLGWDALAGREGAVALLSLSVVSVLAGWARDRMLRLEEQSAVKDRFVAAVSHEVRNPLTGVVGLAEILRDDWDDLDEPMRRELVERIVAGASDMAHIIEDLLDLTRLSTGRLTMSQSPVDLSRAVDAALGEMGDLSVQLDGSAHVLGDSSRVRQILRNLLSNAVRYGGEQVRVHLVEGSGYGLVEVWDDGDGPSPELAGRLFTPFASSGKEGSTGLGLAVSRELARAMGGDLTFRRDDGWTVFRLQLPAATRHPVPA